MYWRLHEKDTRLQSEIYGLSECSMQQATRYKKPIKEHVFPKNHVTGSSKAMRKQEGKEQMFAIIVATMIIKGKAAHSVHSMYR